MSFNAHSKELAQANSQYFYLATGFCLGLLLASFFALFLNRQGWKKYQRMLLRLKRAQKNNALIQQAMHKLNKEQQDNQELLEERVQERTLELNIALQELESVNQELERKNVLDEWTGLHNRRFYDQKILAEYRRSRRNLTALSLVVLDIDHFKLVNDHFGHLAGDQCITWVAKLIKQSLKRTADIAFRYGGEEFCLILPNTDSNGAFLVAEKLRLAVKEQNCKVEDNDITLSISCGIFTYQQEMDIGPEQIFSNADKALYEAKNQGRNRTKQYIFTEQSP
jgi:diguanylate cyclase (GGDEF)-like protein